MSIHDYEHMHTHVQTHMYTHVCAHVYTHVCIHVYIHVYTRVYTSVYMCTSSLLTLSIDMHGHPFGYVCINILCVCVLTDLLSLLDWVS